MQLPSIVRSFFAAPYHWDLAFLDNFAQFARFSTLLFSLVLRFSTDSPGVCIRPQKSLLQAIPCHNKQFISIFVTFCFFFELGEIRCDHCSFEVLLLYCNQFNRFCVYQIGFPFLRCFLALVFHSFPCHPFWAAASLCASAAHAALQFWLFTVFLHSALQHSFTISSRLLIYLFAEISKSKVVLTLLNPW